MSVSGPILVFLANGVQGSAVVRAAARRGHVVHALVRDAKKQIDQAFGCPKIVQGDLNDPASLLTAGSGAAHFILQVPIDEKATMLRQINNALDAARVVNARSIILQLASASRPEPCPEPSFVANAFIEQIVRDAGIPFAIVRPTMYLDNLLKPSALADIVDRGIFSPPIAARQRVAWTSADDCAEAAMLLIERGLYGNDHRIVGPESVTGDELAARLSAGIGRRVRFCAQSIDMFEREVDQAMGVGVGRRVASKFRYFADHPGDADRILAAPFESSPALPGLVPTPIEIWARQHRHSFR